MDREEGRGDEKKERGTVVDMRTEGGRYIMRGSGKRERNRVAEFSLNADCEFQADFSQRERQR
jgi:hypothetical protein